MDPNNWHSMSLDRKDSNKGYTFENTVIVTKFVNTAKSNIQIDAFRENIVEVYNGMKDIYGI